MKKLILLLVATTTLVACDNGIGENLESLTAQLAAINADLAAQTSDVQLSIEDITADLIAAQATVDANNQAVQDAIDTIGILQDRLDAVLVEIQSAATQEQIVALAADVAEISEAIQLLKDYGDSDYDGIINFLDKCPDTDPGVEVGTDGCPLTD